MMHCSASRKQCIAFAAKVKLQGTGFDRVHFISHPSCLVSNTNVIKLILRKSRSHLVQIFLGMCRNFKHNVSPLRPFMQNNINNLPNIALVSVAVSMSCFNCFQLTIGIDTETYLHISHTSFCYSCICRLFVYKGYHIMRHQQYISDKKVKAWEG